jgi:endonuclease YncB( thermonuclease family)
MRMWVSAARVGVAVGLLGATLASPFGLTSGAAAVAHPSGNHHLIYCYGTVSKVDDGDTVNVRLTSGCPGGTKGYVMVVRNAGIQATEISHNGSKAECWSAAGKNFFGRLMPRGSKVRLSSYGATINHDLTGAGKTRYVKYVDAWVGGRWVDVQAAELKAGDAMYKQESVETAHLASYIRDEQAAMYNGRGMWGNPTKCSDKYSPNAQLQSWIVWKTDGPDDAATAHEESFDVRNIGTQTINLSHWAIRDGSHYFAGGTQFNVKAQHTYLVLPKGTMLRPHHTLVIHPSHGRNEPAKDVFFDNGRAIGGAGGSSPNYFGNAAMAHGGRGAHPSSGYPHGAGLFLVDPARDFRAWATYPCVYKCGMPAQLTLTADSGANDHGRELVKLHNPSNDSVGLTGDVIDMDGRVLNLSGDLAGGATLTVHCQGKGRNTPLKRYWDNLANQLPNSGGTIWLRTATDITIAKYTWGQGGHYNYYK